VTSSAVLEQGWKLDKFTCRNCRTVVHAWPYKRERDFAYWRRLGLCGPCRTASRQVRVHERLQPELEAKPFVKPPKAVKAPPRRTPVMVAAHYLLPRPVLKDGKVILAPARARTGRPVKPVVRCQACHRVLDPDGKCWDCQGLGAPVRPRWPGQ
jgi:hypothetical protein